MSVSIGNKVINNNLLVNFISRAYRVLIKTLITIIPFNLYWSLFQLIQIPPRLENTSSNFMIGYILNSLVWQHKLLGFSFDPTGEVEAN